MKTNNFHRSFQYTKEKWSFIRVKGRKMFLLKHGVFKIGIVVWLIICFGRSISKPDFEFSHVAISTLMENYLIGLPFSILIGIISTYYIWNSYESKYSNK